MQQEQDAVKGVNGVGGSVNVWKLSHAFKPLKSKRFSHLINAEQNVQTGLTFKLNESFVCICLEFSLVVFTQS